jgi:hypothetical protein
MRKETTKRSERQVMNKEEEEESFLPLAKQVLEKIVNERREGEKEAA